MRAFLAALGLFTVIPAPPVLEVDRGVARRAMLAFPWLGLLLGAVAGAALFGVAAAGASPLLGAGVALALLAAFTGALHLDGVADTADGLGSRKPAPDALAIMRRSDIGPMGVVTLVFVLLLGVATLASLPPIQAWAAVAVGAMLARTAVVLATVPEASARTQGFGALFVGVTSQVAAAFTVILVMLVAIGVGWTIADPMGGAAFALGAGTSLGVAWGWAAHLRRRLGGYTGDTFGSIIEVTQLVFWLVVTLGLSIQ